MVHAIDIILNPDGGGTCFRMWFTATNKFMKSFAVLIKQSEQKSSNEGAWPILDCAGKRSHILDSAESKNAYTK